MTSGRTSRRVLLSLKDRRVVGNTKPSELVRRTENKQALLFGLPFLHELSSEGGVLADVVVGNFGVGNGPRAGEEGVILREENWISMNWSSNLDGLQKYGPYLHVLANTGKIDDGVDTDGAELGRVTNTGKKEKLRGLESTGTEDDLLRYVEGVARCW